MKQEDGELAARAVMRRSQTVLADRGVALAAIVLIHVYLPKMADFPGLNRCA